MTYIFEKISHHVRLQPARWCMVSVLSFAFIVSVQVAAHAEEGQSTEMWGTFSSTDGYSSEMMHQSAGVVAGQVNSAKRGILYAGPTMTVVGSQSIVQVTGHNNVVSDISQDAVNSGNLELNSQVN
jgi:hypothetical protein